MTFKKWWKENRSKMIDLVYATNRGTIDICKTTWEAALKLGGRRKTVRRTSRPRK